MRPAIMLSGSKGRVLDPRLLACRSDVEVHHFFCCRCNQPLGFRSGCRSKKCRTGRRIAQKRRCLREGPRAGSPHSGRGACSITGKATALPSMPKRARLTAYTSVLPLSDHVDPVASVGVCSTNRAAAATLLPNVGEQQVASIPFDLDQQCLEEFTSQLPGLEDWQETWVEPLEQLSTTGVGPLAFSGIAVDVV